MGSRLRLRSPSWAIWCITKPSWPDLRARGIRVENRLDAITTPSVMITAHGTSEKTLQVARERGLRVLEATCPLVHHAHRAIQNLVREKFHPVIIGRRDHVEVRGLTGDLAEFDVILTDDDVRQLAERPRFGVAAQTTQPIDRVRHLVGLMRQRFPRSEIRFVDTVCQPTKQRQEAAVEMARQADVVIVVGGAAQQQHPRTGGHLPPVLRAGASGGGRRRLARGMAEWRANGRTDRRDLHARSGD
jgi:(E)-4-hydroxy-3-methyl-but-2-enyl pyrophosphate reductase